MPLCTATTWRLQSVCGCAFASVGRPCVAQRVCPMPTEPGEFEPASFSTSVESFPAARWIVKLPLQSVAMPAESYPRYSRRFKPSMRRGAASFDPTYPTMPHMLTTGDRLKSVPHFSLSFCRLAGSPFRGPPLEVLLRGAGDRESAVRH